MVIMKYITGMGRSRASRKIDKDCINTKTPRAEKKGEDILGEGRGGDGEKQLWTAYHTIYRKSVLNIMTMMMMTIIIMKFIFCDSHSG